MKKILTVFLVFITVFTLFGCKSANDISHSGYKKCSKLSYDYNTYTANIQVATVAEYYNFDENSYIYCSVTVYNSDKSSTYKKELFDNPTEKFSSTINVNKYSSLFTSETIEYTFKRTIGEIITNRNVVEYNEKEKKAIITNTSNANINIPNDIYKALSESNIYCYNGSQKFNPDSKYYLSEFRHEQTETFCDLSNVSSFTYVFE